MPDSVREPLIAVTDPAWFQFLSGRSINGRVDEVNFWFPKATIPIRNMVVGEPVFLRLKEPFNAIAGYGFYAHFEVMSLQLAWDAFAWKNGDPDRLHFFSRIGGYRGVNLLAPSAVPKPIGCMILRDATFWPKEWWLPWGADQGWKPNIVRGRGEDDAVRAAQLLETLHDVAAPDDLTDVFEMVEIDEREVVMREAAVREGQGTFRVRLLEAYDGQCAITGEHTVPVLDAAHIQPYLGPKSNHLQNGLVLTKEFHALFDAGYVGITPDYEVRISDRLKAEWNNGKRYYAYDKQPLIHRPDNPALHPSRDALAWHYERRFKKAG